LAESNDLITLLTGSGGRDTRRADAIIERLIQDRLGIPQPGAEKREAERGRNVGIAESIQPYSATNIPVLGPLLQMVGDSPVGSLLKAPLPESFDVGMFGAEPTGAGPWDFKPGLGGKDPVALDPESALEVINSLPGLSSTDRARYKAQISRVNDIVSANTDYSSMQANKGEPWGLPEEKFSNLEVLKKEMDRDGAAPSATSDFINAVTGIKNRRAATAARKAQVSGGISYTTVEENVIGKDGNYVYDPVSGLPVKQKVRIGTDNASGEIVSETKLSGTILGSQVSPTAAQAVATQRALDTYERAQVTSIEERSRSTQQQIIGLTKNIRSMGKLWMPTMTKWENNKGPSPIGTSGRLAVGTANFMNTVGQLTNMISGMGKLSPEERSANPNYVIPGAMSMNKFRLPRADAIFSDTEIPGVDQISGEYFVGAAKSLRNFTRGDALAEFEEGGWEDMHSNIMAEAGGNAKIAAEIAAETKGMAIGLSMIESAGRMSRTATSVSNPVAATIQEQMRDLSQYRTLASRGAYFKQRMKIKIEEIIIRSKEEIRQAELSGVRVDPYLRQQWDPKLLEAYDIDPNIFNTGVVEGSPDTEGPPVRLFDGSSGSASSDGTFVVQPR